MNFLQLTQQSSNEIEAFVRRFIDDTEAAPTFVQIIKDFAGTEEIAKALNAILLRWEALYGNAHFENGYTQTNRGGRDDNMGVINGNKFCMFFLGRRAPPGGHPMVECRMHAKWCPDGDFAWVAFKHHTVGTIAVDQWNFNTRRALIIKALLLQYNDQRCRFCDVLLPQAGVCSRCEVVINKKSCPLCKGRVGQLRKKRGRVYVHEACEKRQRTK